ncbi:S-adenosyl-L-methionine-dependent methyltransferases superfamily protein [Hibiscus syriacus]|uniref:S-adenosyl-L-methionine-dependent methyltransferases superfamily protein n=1 Tax=Hibiscus syriacus TaxID=106335 RepID=A0A6A3D793_HIBSY|nr:probable calcium-binding protein CML44 [Hibiscus syriacus]KAE8735109.1 S-adenosyl-L-methionine-dependent methyltransferases superfamily protein [Hibiscus syriacus]
MFSSSYLQETLNNKASTFHHVTGGGDILSDYMSPLSKNDLRRIFEKLDKNGDGFVSLEELNWLLQRIGSVQFSLQELEPLVGKPCLNFDDFLFFYDSISNPTTMTATSNPSTSSDDDEEEELVVHGGDGDEDGDLAEAFKVFDLNGDGFISCEELEKVLGRLGLWDEKSGKDCREMIWFYDTNMDGMVDFQEFKHMMLHSVNS